MSESVCPPPDCKPTSPAGPKSNVSTFGALLFVGASMFMVLGLPGWLMYSVTHEPMASDADKAIGKLMSLEIAQDTYRGTDPDGDGVNAYGSLEDLVQGDLIDRDLQTGSFRGYRYSCTPSPIDSSTRWLATATPLPGSSNTTHFAVNQDGKILVLDDKPFPTDPDAPLPADARPLDW